MCAFRIPIKTCAKWFGLYLTSAAFRTSRCEGHEWLSPCYWIKMPFPESTLELNQHLPDIKLMNWLIISVPFLRNFLISSSLSTFYVFPMFSQLTNARLTYSMCCLDCCVNWAQLKERKLCTTLCTFSKFNLVSRITSKASQWVEYFVPQDTSHLR